MNFSQWKLYHLPEQPHKHCFIQSGCLKTKRHQHPVHSIVTGKHGTPRSYMITDETGREYRRNRRHVHLAQEAPVTILNDDLIDVTSCVNPV